jgi:hypothetical protein
MILGIPSRPGFRVLVASQPVDFRNYAEATIMRSPWTVVPFFLSE